MVYEHFLKHICNLLKERLKEQEGKRLECQSMLKNNGIRSDSVFLIREGVQLLPSVAVKPFYEEYQGGRPMEEIAEALCELLEEPAPELGIDPEGFGRFDQQKERIVFRLINYGDNKELLTNHPHIRLCDLAIVFCLYLKDSQDYYMTALIRREHMEFWKADAAMLYELAKVNTPKLMPCVIVSMESMLSKLIVEDLGMEEGKFSLPKRPQDMPGMHILTNAQGLYGAGCILYDSVLEQFANQLDQDIYILPSSIHEVILLQSGNYETKYLQNMVRQVNEEEVAAEEQLSDSLYLYNRKERSLTLVP